MLFFLIHNAYYNSYFPKSDENFKKKNEDSHLLSFSILKNLSLFVNLFAHSFFLYLSSISSWQPLSLSLSLSLSQKPIKLGSKLFVFFPQLLM